MDFAELRDLDAGYTFSPDGESYPYRDTGVVIPRLEEILEAFPETPLLIEPKRETVPPTELLEILRSYDRIGDVMLGAFEDSVYGDRTGSSNRRSPLAIRAEGGPTAVAHPPGERAWLRQPLGPDRLLPP
ncbi:MAG: hypothetical protein U5K37_10225 [Natrialbaceae archaeon]|nr:hypothetical protein [Natrialbaceae archaeon]